MSILNYILYAVIAVSFVGLAVIIYKKVPALTRLSEEEISILRRKKSFLQKIKDIDYKKNWLSFIVGLEKFLRKVKIIFLRIENVLGKWIRGLRNQSQVMTQKSREWIKEKEMKRRSKKEQPTEPEKEVILKVNEKNNKETERKEQEIDEDDLPISELEKPIKEEQKWINLIVENPKNITAYKFLGLLYWKQHNYPDAKSSLEMAVRLGSKDRKVKEVLKEIKEMGIE